jgi:hypothetical protein
MGSKSFPSPCNISLKNVSDKTGTTNKKKSSIYSHQHTIMGFVKFVRHFRDRLLRRGVYRRQDIAVALALYGVYPAILWLLIDRFHGICGSSVYVQKATAVAANKSVFL